MKDFNICKFPTIMSESTLKVRSFVWEKNHKLMLETANLVINRIFLVAEGTGEFIFNDKERFSVKTGNMVFAFAYESVRCDKIDGLEYVYLSFEGTRAQELMERFSISPNNRIFNGMDFLLPFWKEGLISAQESNFDLVSESTLIYTFSKLTAERKQTHPLVDKMLKLSYENFSNPQLSLKALSLELNYNEKYLSHLFKSQVKMGFTEYLRSLRIKNAVTLFDLGLDSVKNVAILSGFTDPLYFSSVFKAEIGVPPTEYARKKRKEKN